jgi:hypothetical protein
VIYKIRVILYREKQLQSAYDEYRKMHIRKDVPFLTLEEFRILYEFMANEFYTV